MKYYPRQFDSFEDYQKDLRSMALFTWIAFFFLFGVAVGFAYFGWKTAPWVIGAFAFFQNLPLAILYTMRYNWSKEPDDDPESTRDFEIMRKVERNGEKYEP